MSMEEATLRAKIQAMKNLLEAKRQSASVAIHARRNGFHAPSRKYVRPSSGPVNRTWSRFSSSAAPSANVTGAGSVHKVWRREESSATAAVPTVGKNREWKRPVKVTANKSVRPMIKRGNKSMQLQLLRLEDGEYAKANGGFSLVRSGVKKPVVATNPGHPRSITTLTMPVTRSKNSVSIAGVKYVVANGGKMLRRCSLGDINKAISAAKQGSASMGVKGEAARAALVRARAAIQRARTKRFQARKGVKVRTEYCSFYNRFGFCKNKNDCRFIHDSRRVAMCRKFLRNECNDPKCLLSHQNDENKVPVCKMFLRGACTREGCKYRHVKVSATAKLCEAFTKGYCPKGDACELRHEIAHKKKLTPTSATHTSSGMGSNGKSSKGTLSSSCSSSPERIAGDESCEVGSVSSIPPKDISPTSSSSEYTSKDGKTELSIRPNIRFASKHKTGFPSLFEGLRQATK